MRTTYGQVTSPFGPDFERHDLTLGLFETRSLKVIRVKQVSPEGIYRHFRAFVTELSVVVSRLQEVLDKIGYFQTVKIVIMSVGKYGIFVILIFRSIIN